MPSVPTIHLNGSSAETLLTDYQAALDAVTEALTKVSTTYPHSRDYHLQGDDAFLQAELEYRARVEHLKTVREELLHVIGAIQDQVSERDMNTR